jgi:hypothetical protein
MESILDGDLEGVLEKLVLQSQAQALGEMSTAPGQAKDLGS